ncbi:hypothetical protein SAMN05878281_0096 [Salegentibacter salegens]|uniref:Uncharacterized protein n=1 Tax=Salegentibacter salegens TaxID=143223 RepID=A0A1M7HET7_9FLAO|nr:hypothetical protein LY58_02297 [Salegentibacter salegens]SHM26647.1 hypothetical protein SAMN05878281_0096 [Salegentibacter salegens]
MTSKSTKKQLLDTSKTALTFRFTLLEVMVFLINVYIVNTQSQLHQLTNPKLINDSRTHESRIKNSLLQ